MTNPVIRMELFQTLAVVPLDVYSAGTFERNLYPQGNALLSTLFVQAISFGATVTVSYHESTVGDSVGEDTVLKAHTTPTAGTSDKIIVPKIHNKPRVRVTVTGGTATLGVYVSVISSVASDLDSSLFRDAAAANLLADIGSQTVIFDDVQNKHYFARGASGVQDVKIDGGSVQSTPSGLKIGGRHSFVTINSTTWTKVPATALTDRNSMGLFNESSVKIKFRYLEGIGDTLFRGTPIPANGSSQFRDITDAIDIYCKCETGTVEVTVEEIA
jgi:hypothetical protein